MPFTPFHFGPHGALALASRSRIDLPVFVLVNVVIDVEPGVVLLASLPVPLHGISHTLLVATLLGALIAGLAWRAREWICRAMATLRLPYRPAFRVMLASGVIGAWLHVLLDATLYEEMRPFFPLPGNPLRLGLDWAVVVYGICALCVVPAAILYARLRTDS